MSKISKKHILSAVAILVYFVLLLVFYKTVLARSIVDNNIPNFIQPHEIVTFNPVENDVCSARTSNKESSLTLIKKDDSSPLPQEGVYQLSYQFVTLLNFNPKPPPYVNFSLYYFVNNSDKEIVIMQCKEIK